MIATICIVLHTVHYVYACTGIDGAHMKTVNLGPNEKLRDMTFILLTGKLVGNNEVVLAWILAYTENSIDIKYMLTTMADNGIIIDRKEVTMVSDRGSALIKSYEDFFKAASHKYCDLHITRAFPPTWSSHTLYWSARNAPTKHSLRMQWQGCWSRAQRCMPT